MSQLRDEIKQCRPFASREQEAFLGIGRTWALLDHEVADVLKPYGITPTQYNVLRILHGAGETGLCRGEVIDRMIARVPDATRLLDRLEAVGLIMRERASDDRRFVTTRIAPEGVGLLRTLETPVLELHLRQFANLSAGQQQELIGLCDLARDRK